MVNDMRDLRGVPAVLRFWSHVNWTDYCWTWMGAADRDGYGRFHVPRGETDTAHRVAWRLTFGPIPDGLQVLHKCDNPPCVRPDHLYVGTNEDNVRDKVERGRQYNGQHPRTGSLRQRHEGRWELRLALGRDPVTGVYHRLSRTVHGDRATAEAVLAALLKVTQPAAQP
jgi:hypothetical protein